MVKEDSTYRVKQCKLFVHHLQRRGHLLVIALELLQDGLSLALGQLNKQALGRLNVESRNEQMGAV